MKARKAELEFISSLKKSEHEVIKNLKESCFEANHLYNDLLKSSVSFQRRYNKLWENLQSKYQIPEYQEDIELEKKLNNVEYISETWNKEKSLKSYSLEEDERNEEDSSIMYCSVCNEVMETKEFYCDAYQCPSPHAHYSCVNLNKFNKYYCDECLQQCYFMTGEEDVSTFNHELIHNCLESDNIPGICERSNGKYQASTTKKSYNTAKEAFAVYCNKQKIKEQDYGIFKQSKKFRARVTVNRKSIDLGVHKEKINAIVTRDEYIKMNNLVNAKLNYDYYNEDYTSIDTSYCDICSCVLIDKVGIGCSGDCDTCDTWTCLSCSPFKSREEASKSEWYCSKHTNDTEDVNTCETCSCVLIDKVGIGCSGDCDTCDTWTCLGCSPFKSREEASTSEWYCSKHTNDSEDYDTQEDIISEDSDYIPEYDRCSKLKEANTCRTTNKSSKRKYDKCKKSKQVNTCRTKCVFSENCVLSQYIKNVQIYNSEQVYTIHINEITREHVKYHGKDVCKSHCGRYYHVKTKRILPKKTEDRYQYLL